MSNYPYARYTETLYEFIDRNPTFLNDIFKTFIDETHATALINMFRSKWGAYEISGETEDLFKQYIEDSYNQWKDYYTELISNYEKDWDFTKGTTRENYTSYNSNNKSTDNNEEILYDLPHKQVEEIKKYPDNVTSNTGNVNRDIKGDTKATFTDNRIYLEQKEKYLMMIRNVYDEFCFRFRDCFIPVFN